jgi:predicted DsbA family dithiol-disulfide isomerase
VYAVLREIPADLQASTTFAVLAKDDRNGSRHGNALGTDFDERLDIIPRTVQMNVTTEAASLQDRFWEMHDLLYREQSVWSNVPDVGVLFSAYAGMLGLNIDRFKKDMQSEQAKARVRSDEQQALALGLATTPSIFVNNRKLPGAYTNPPGLRIAIDSAITKASK